MWRVFCGEVVGIFWGLGFSYPELALSAFNPPSPFTPPKSLRIGAVSRRLSSRVSVSTGGSSLLIEPHRHMIAHGERQKNHATPYNCLSQLLHTLFEDVDISKAGGKIQDIADIFLPDKKQQFTEIMDFHQEEIREIAVGKSRKEATQAIRSGFFLAGLLSDPKVLEVIQSSGLGINIQEVEVHCQIIRTYAPTILTLGFLSCSMR